MSEFLTGRYSWLIEGNIFFRDPVTKRFLLKQAILMGLYFILTIHIPVCLALWFATKSKLISSIVWWKVGADHVFAASTSAVWVVLPYIKRIIQ